MSLHFLLEIGTEEIPHWMIPGAIEQLAKIDLLEASPQVDATPRRLVIRASGVPEKQADSQQLLKGPPVASGAMAQKGFADKNKVTISEVQRDDTGKYWVLLKKTPGRPTMDLLAESIPRLILGLQWPKSMYWTGGKTGPRFIRPIRWIVALLGGQVIPFEIAGVMSGNITRGHRRLGSAHIPITLESYESELRKNFVILSSEERREKIVKEVTHLGAKHDEDLIETLTFITEYPAAIRGDFDPAYLELPAEVLTTVMRHHQKYFSVEKTPGVLDNHFVAVMNIPADPEGLVRKGNERVLRARFNDARFFWNVDQQKKLKDRVEDLKKVTFQAKLGSYYDKTLKIMELVSALGGSTAAQEAARLSKCDLTTDMVKEFTDLQGVVGGLYAKAQGESDAVADAIYEHYKPLSMDDSIPVTPSGCVLALADKLDTLIRCFKHGLVPTGSRDPYALRRAAQGVVKILVNTQIAFPLDNFEEFTQELTAFFKDRVQYYFREVEGFKYDEVNAVLSKGYESLPDVKLRLQAVAAVRPTEDFEAVAEGCKRIRGILEKAKFQGKGSAIREDAFEEGPERNLYKKFQEVVSSASEHFADRGYIPFLETIAGARPAVDAFFDNVRVDVPENDIRERRLELLYRIDMQFNAIADFSEIVTSGEQK